MARITIHDPSVGELTFDYESGGSGEPVVLLHGFPETAAGWQPVAKLLQDSGFTTYAPDQRGYSPDARPQNVADYHTDRLAADIIALLDAWNIERAHLVGHDWGASVAWVVAAKHPQRLRSLTTVSVPHLAAYGWALQNDADQQERARYIGLFRKPGKAEEVLLENNAERLIATFENRVPDEFVRAHVAALSEPGALTAALNWYRAMTADLSELPAIDVPTTYVWSTEDLALGRAGAERTAEFVNADYRFVELPGVSHWIAEEAPQALAQAIIDRARSVQ